MNVELIKNHGINPSADVEKNQYGNPTLSNSRMKTEEMGFSLDITGKVMENAAYGKEELKSAQEIAQTAGMRNVSLERNYMAVMSNSMSDEDFQELCKDGVNPTQTTVEHSVTNLDKIKIKMAEAGITVEGFNDDLSAEDIEAVAGSAAVSMTMNHIQSGTADGMVQGTDSDLLSSANINTTIAQSLSAGNLPDTKENVEAVKEAIDVATNLKPFTDDTVKYMINEDLEPTIENIYKAEYSSGNNTHANTNQFTYSGAATYGNTRGNEAAWEDIRQQATEIVSEAGIENLDDGLADARWMVENQIPLTSENLIKYEELKSLSLPLSEDRALETIGYAIAEGKEPMMADITRTESIYDQAARLVKEFSMMEDGGDLVRHRQLEEVRLAMTAEANLMLIKKGVQIDTQPLEKLVDILKEAEQEFYRPLLTDESDSAKNTSDNDSADNYSLNTGISLEDKINIYKATRSIVDELPSIPVKSIADVAMANETDGVDFNLQEISSAAIENRAAYDRAGQSYEALMTAPRADMGDSIRKAFGNVDDILEDLGFECNDTNRKAVRTLGYSQMEINSDNIVKIREATMVVSRVAELMTPSRTLRMIREGHNPLEENIYELEKNLSEEEPEETAEKYSQYLAKLERRGEITENEKSAFIGMYRLLHQIEIRDGAVIGNVLSNGQELTLQNMLSASRSNKHKNMDIKVDDDFGVLEELSTKGESITDQISKVFVELLNEPLSKEYVNDKQKDIKKAAKSDPEISDMLKMIDEPVTVQNIIAFGDMLYNGGKAVKKLFGNNAESSDSENQNKEDYADSLSGEDVSEMLDRFTDSGSAMEAYSKFIEKAEKITENYMENADKYNEVKDWIMIHKQLGFASSLSKRETYDIPLYTEEGYTNIHLTIQHSQEESGKVTASFSSEEYGRVSARFALTEEGVDGFIVTDSRSAEAAIKNKTDDFTKAFQSEGIATKNLTVVFSKNAKADDYVGAGDTVKTANSKLYGIAKAFIKGMEKGVTNESKF